MIFVTSIVKSDGLVYDGPRIEAATWEDAEAYCKANKIKLVGRFAYEIEISDKESQSIFRYIQRSN